MANKNDLAPVVLFVYNRPEHTRETLKYLQANHLADKTILYIFCDGPKDNADPKTLMAIDEVRKTIRLEQWCKEVVIKEEEENKGLANSIIDGVTSIIRLHEKVIVLEDDLLTGRYFLDFMNRALDQYEDHKEVMQISGYSYTPLSKLKRKDAMVFPFTTTWGWATWIDVWETVDWSCKNALGTLKQPRLKKLFNLGGAYDYTNMLTQQLSSNTEISSWGVRFYWHVFKLKGLVLYPSHSLIRNSGWDGSGFHKDNYEVFPLENWRITFRQEEFPINPTVDKTILGQIQQYIRSRTSFYNRAISKFRQIF